MFYIGLIIYASFGCVTISSHASFWCVTISSHASFGCVTISSHVCVIYYDCQWVTDVIMSQDICVGFIINSSTFRICMRKYALSAGK